MRKYNIYLFIHLKFLKEFLYFFTFCKIMSMLRNRKKQLQQSKLGDKLIFFDDFKSNIYIF